MKTYLKPVVRRLTDNREIHNYVDRLDKDCEILDYLETKGHGYSTVSKAFENHYGVDFVNLKDYTITKELQDNFAIDSLVRELIIPFKEDKTNKTYYFAMHDIFKEDLKTQVKMTCRTKGYTAIFKYAYGFEIQDKYRRLSNVGTLPKPTRTERTKSSTDGAFSAAEWLDNILETAIDKGASDIHIETLVDSLRVRLRVDGILQTEEEYDFTEKEIGSVLVRVKLISAMDISEKRKAQDGRIDNYGKDRKFDFRVSSLKTLYGEKIAMRLIERQQKTLTFADLGFTSKATETVKRVLNNQNGIIYLAGATGSGKTTTLYTMIEEVSTDNVNVYTIEDPIEKTLPGVNQIQLDELAGVTYPDTLKALLRQDPDIIVVGEIRDSETAELSIRASLTGHLVMTTLHANNAVDSISRLFDMGVESYLMGASTLAIMSQRLVRVLCPECKKEVTPTTAEKDWIEKMGSTVSPTLFEPTGCDNCTAGYKGRVAVVEVIEVTDKIKDLISTRATAEQIRTAAIDDGYKTVLQEAIDIASEGITSISEVMRIM